jgi:hypothetical protein
LERFALALQAAVMIDLCYQRLVTELTEGLIHVVIVKALRASRHATSTQCGSCGFKVGVRGSLGFDETMRSKETEVKRKGLGIDRR